jgi:NADH:ubiquinone oxidoreductase subunit 4 (subunit M)
MIRNNKPLVINIIASLICFFIFINSINQENWRIVFSSIGLVGFTILSIVSYKKNAIDKS